MLRNSKAYIIGNGPSARAIAEDNTYGCNISGMKYNPKYLCSSDPWLQYDIIRAGHEGICLFNDFVPIPAEIIPEGFIESQIPPDYDCIIHNPEQQEGAVGWHFYCTGETLNEHWTKNMGVQPDYWRTRRAYICFIPPTMTIHNVTPLEKTKQEPLAPSGVYAIHHAIENGATEIHTYGFDSMAGVMMTESRYDSKSHDATQQDRFIQWYKRMAEWHPEVKIIWHTIKE